MYVACGSSAWSWLRDVTGQPKRPHSVETFRIRDVSRHAARACELCTAISRLRQLCGESCHQLRPQKIPTGAGGFTSSFSLFLALHHGVMHAVLHRRPEKRVRPVGREAVQCEQLSIHL